MKIQVKNLGILNEVEIDMKPMTIFVGPNNSGKTLLAYVLLAIFGQTGLEKYGSGLDKDKITEMYPPLDGIIQELINEGNTKIDLYQFADKYAEVYINDVAQGAKKWLVEFMQVDRFSFDELEVNIHLEQQKEQMLNRIISTEINSGFSFGRRRKEPLVNATKKRGDQMLYFYTAGSIENLPADVISTFVLAGVFTNIHKGLYRNAHAFPTERTTFIPLISSLLSTMLADIGNTSKTSRKSLSRAKIREILDNEISYRGSGPLGHFLNLMMSGIRGSLRKRNGEVQGNPLIETYGILSQMLQKEILGGNLDVASGDELGISQELIFAPRQDVSLEMNIVSSMVKELAPLALYLKYSAQPGELLIMDEPEMNLHPEAQVKLTELLTMLVNADLPLLFTTHSPYIVDHLMNLLKAYEHEDKESIKEEFYLQKTEAFISKDNVAVYLFEDGTAKNILREDGLIQWGTFGTVSDRITQIYFDL